MTAIQKQAILYKLEYLPLSGVDGIWGRQTEAAVSKALGTAQEQTSTFWEEIEYFTREEFRCQCGGKYCDGFPAEPQEELVRTVDEIRRRLGIPVTIGSGVRCENHNANVGGVANSRHMYGDGADLYSAESPEWMAAIAEDVLGNTGGLGIYSWGIHVDTSKFSRWRG